MAVQICRISKTRVFVGFEPDMQRRPKTIDRVYLNAAPKGNDKQGGFVLKVVGSNG